MHLKCAITTSIIKIDLHKVTTIKIMQSYITKRFMKTTWHYNTYYYMTDCYHTILFSKHIVDGYRLKCLDCHYPFLIKFNYNMFSKILYSSVTEYLKTYDIIKAVKLSLLLPSLKRIKLHKYCVYNILHIIKIFKHKSLTHCEINSYNYFTNHLVIFIL